MLYSLNGNAFSFLSNTDKSSIPVVRTNPLALYGANLVYWFDFTDSSTLFTDTGATTNVVNYGDTIRAVRSKSNYAQLIRNTGATPSYVYSSVSIFNSYSGLYKTGISSTTDTFLESTNSIMTANTLYAVHVVMSVPTTPTNFNSGLYKLAGFPTVTNGVFYLNKDLANKLLLTNSGNDGDDLRGPLAGTPPLASWNNSYTIFSFMVSFSAATNLSYPMPINSSKSILNNNYFGPRVHTATVAKGLFSTGTHRLLLCSPIAGARLMQGFYLQEFILYQKDADDGRFQAGHQYLRQKYLS
jgi:hypothetical protein